MTHTYLVVKFKEDNDSVGVISSVWGFEKNTKCFYPDEERNVDKYLKKHKTPTVMWTQHSIQVLKECDTYSKARDSMKKACYESNLETSDDEASKKNRKLVMKKTYSDALSSSSEPDCPPKKTKSVPPKYPKIISKLGPSSEVREQHNVDEISYPVTNTLSPTKSTQTFVIEMAEPSTPLFHSSPVSQTQQPSFVMTPTFFSSPVSHTQQSTSSCAASPVILPHHCNNPTLPATDSECIRAIFNIVSDLKDKLNKMTKQDRQANLEEHLMDHLSVERLANLPLKTMEAFDQLEDGLNDKNMSKKLVRLLANIGGSEVKNFIYAIMRKLMTCELALQFSLTGRSAPGEAKRPLIKTNTFKCVKWACLKVHGDRSSEQIVQSTVSQWLQQAKFRISRRGSKGEGNQNKDVQEDAA